MTQLKATFLKNITWKTIHYNLIFTEELMCCVNSISLRKLKRVSGKMINLILLHISTKLKKGQQLQVKNISLSKLNFKIVFK